MSGFRSGLAEDIKGLLSRHCQCLFSRVMTSALRSLMILTCCRYGQILEAAVCSRTPVDRDLITLANQLPPNRLLHIVLNNLSS